MKLAILGATGRTGLCLVRQALDQGHEVVSLMRNIENYPIQHEKLQVVNGNIFSVESLAGHFEGCDAVMSCLGASTLRNVTLYSTSIPTIADALRKVGLLKLVVVTSWCTSYDPEDPGPFVLEKVLKKTIMKSTFADMAKMEKFLVDSCSDINYVVVRPPRLSNGPMTDIPLKIEVDRLLVPGVGYPSLSRDDVARCMLNCLVTNEYDKKMIAIAT